MWFRDDSQPAEYGGQPFRSGLEAKVAKELDGLGVKWRYEVPVAEALSWVDGSYAAAPPNIPRYLPDFTILEAEEDLQLPLWIEVKPAELLWAVRDHCGLSERFEDDVTNPINAATMHKANLTEICKPKLLAEVTQRDVLVVSAINRDRTLSILAAPDRIVLSRQHPTVNHKKLVKDHQKAEQQARWRAEWAAREAARKAAAVQTELQQRAQLREWLKGFSQDCRQAGYNDRCWICRADKAADQLVMARREGRWIVICKTHLNIP